MKKLILIHLSLPILITSICGCANLRLGPSDEDLIRSTIAHWKVAMATENIDRLLACYSEDYINSRGENKETMRELMTRVFDSGFMDSVEINTEKAQITIEADTAKVAPIDFISDRGVWPMELTLRKENGKWLITGSEGFQK